MSATTEAHGKQELTGPGKRQAKIKARNHVRAFMNWMRAVELNPETKYKRLLVFFRLFFGRGESLETLQQLFLGHALDGDLGVVGIDARSGRTNQRDRIGLRLVHLDEFLQGMNEFFAQILGRNRRISDFTQ